MPGNLSDYAENKMLDLQVRGVVITSPAEAGALSNVNC